MNLIYLLVEVRILWDMGVILFIFTFCFVGGDRDSLADSCWKENQELWILPTL